MDDGEGDVAAAGNQQFDQGDGEEHRHRIVHAGFHLQRGADALAQFHAALMQQQEHRRGVGRGDDGAGQQSRDPGQIEQPDRGQTGDGGGDQNTDCRHDAGRRPGDAYRPQRRAQPAIEQDDRQRQAAQQVGRLKIIELDAKSIFPCRHAERQEDQQQGCADPRGQHPRNDTDDQQRAAEKDKLVG